MSHLSRILAMAPKGSEDRPADSGDAVVWGDAADGALFVVSPYIEGEDAEHLLDEVVSSGEMVSVWLQGEEDSLFADGGLEELFLGTRRGVACFVGERVVPVIVRLFQQAHITTLDSKALLAKVIPADTARQASMDIADFDPSRVFDLTIASYLLDSEQASYSLSTLASISSSSCSSPSPPGGADASPPPAASPWRSPFPARSRKMARSVSSRT